MKSNTLVKFDISELPDKYHCEYAKIGLTHGDLYVYLGDIIQMPGHCTVIRMKDNKVITGVHTENFKQTNNDDEVVDIVLD